MPDILSSEKAEIREIAKSYAQALWTIPFNKGFIAYIKTSDEISVHPARWRYCFKCGMILRTNLVKNDETADETRNHACILEFEDIPLLIKTSWIKLRKFFLIDENHKKILKEIGLTILPKPIIITKSTLERESTKKDISEGFTEEST